MDELGVLKACGEASVMIMGMSFVVGSLTTIFILVLLDMYRSRQVSQDAAKE